jgi:hypothetical protein
MHVNIFTRRIAIASVAVMTLHGATLPERTDFPFQYVTQERVLLVRTLTQQDDLRKLFCDFKVLQDRIQRKVAVLEMQGFLLKGDEGVSSKEVYLSKRITMRAFLDTVGLKAWRQAQPQIKLIKQNAILQSPLFGTHTKEDREAFLRSWVEPGDLLVVTRIL